MQSANKDPFPAHIDGSRVQTCQDHCMKTAQYAKASVSGTGLEDAAYLAGLLHDAGKYTAEFREYIQKASRNEKVAKGSVNHTFAGARFMMEHFRRTDENGTFVSLESLRSKNSNIYQALTSVDDNSDTWNATATMIAYAIGAHHGEFDCVDEDGKSGFLHRLETPISYEEAMNNYFTYCTDRKTIDALFQKGNNSLVPVLEYVSENSADSSEELYEDECAFLFGMIERLLLSAVVEGDRRDTAEFMEKKLYPDLNEDRSQFWEDKSSYFEKKISSFSSDSPINAARGEISSQCRKMAESPDGIYKLNVPTGAGKTLASLRYALFHARNYHKKRIIFTAPLISILEQNVKVIREYVGDNDSVLEHHSNLLLEKTDGESLSRQELLEETWDSPIIVTTLVQLLNTLFSGKISSIRRFHSLCDSIIVIDEVQTVPLKMLSMFTTSLKFLRDVCHADIVLCSATQPSFHYAKHPVEGKNLIPFREDLWEPFKRTKISAPEKPGGIRAYTIEEIASFTRSLLKENNSILVVCNTKNEAESLYQLLNDADKNAECFHLSAAMCMAHREKVLNQMYTALGRVSNEHKVICVSTQVIQAGVDISFSCVIRLLSGMDDIIQSAGRCNRNHESEAPGNVYILACSEENMSFLRDILQGQEAATDLLAEFQKDRQRFGGSLDSERSINYYYHSLYQKYASSADQQDYPVKTPDGIWTVYDLLSENNAFCKRGIYSEINAFFLHQAFKKAGELFEVFDTDSSDVLVPYEEGKEIINDLLSKRAEYDFAFVKDRLDRAKRFSVSLFQYQINALQKEGGIIDVSFLGNLKISILSNGYYGVNTGFSLKRITNDYLEAAT